MHTFLRQKEQRCLQTVTLDSKNSANSQASFKPILQVTISVNFVAGFSLEGTQDEITCFRISETWRKHATPCFRYVSVLRKRANSSLCDSVTFPERKCQKVVRFRCDRSNGDVSKRHETANRNTGYPSCFRIGFTCFCDVSVYGFLEFRPVPPGGEKTSLSLEAR